MAASKLQAFWNHPAGPKTVFFWAPAFKWGLISANIADFSQPVEKISSPQQIAVAMSGIIWARYSTIIYPLFTFIIGFQISVFYTQKNWLLFANSIALSSTGLYQLTRKMQHHNSTKKLAIKE